MPTHERLPFTALQRAHPERHPRHVSGAVMVHVTAMLGFAHAYFLLGLRHAEGWIGYGTHIESARYGRLATIGPPLQPRVPRHADAPHPRLDLRALRVPLRAGGRSRLRERAGRRLAPRQDGKPCLFASGAVDPGHHPGDVEAAFSRHRRLTALADCGHEVLDERLRGQGLAQLRAWRPRRPWASAPSTSSRGSASRSRPSSARR